MAKLAYLIAVLPLIAQALAQTPTQQGSASSTQQIVLATTDTTDAQRSAFGANLQAYLSSFQNSPQYTELAANLLFALPPDVLASVRANPESAFLPITGTIDLKSLATAPPLTFPTQNWETYLSGTQIDSIKSLQTSAVLQIASIAQQDVSVTASISVPSATRTSTGGANRPTMVAMGAGVAAIGAAAALL